MANLQEPSPCQDLTGQVTERPSYVASGGFSDIYVGDLTTPAGTNLRVAIKVLRCTGVKGEKLQKKLNDRLRRESRLWQQLNHPNVLPFLGLVSGPFFGPAPALVSPYCSGGTVLDFIKDNPSVERVPMMIGIAKGLQYLHNRDVVHGDLKSQNVLMSDSGNPLLADFGRSKFIERRGYTTDFTCTYRYLAPEILDIGMDGIEDSESTIAAFEDEIGSPPPSPSEPTTTKQTDVYSFALIGVEVLSGVVVYPKVRKGREFEVFQYVRSGGRPNIEDYTGNDGLPSLCPEAGAVWPLLEQWWAIDPQQRPDMDVVVSSLVALHASIIRASSS